MPPDETLYKIFEQLGGIRADVANIKVDVASIKGKFKDSEIEHKQLLSNFEKVKNEHIACLKKRSHIDEIVYRLNNQSNHQQAIKLTAKQRIGFIFAVLPGMGALLIQIYYTFKR